MIEKKKKYKLSDFRYQLPKRFIAQKPKRKRENSKMMVLNREDRTITHKKFVNIVDYFQKNDLLIINDTKVFPARLFATKDRTDAKVEIFLLRELGDRLWEVLVKPARKVRIGNKLILSYAGESLDSDNLPENWKIQIKTILDKLKDINCSHNDIKPTDLLFLNGNIMLIDFQWATKINQPIPHNWPSCIGGIYRNTEKFDDKHSIYKSIESISTLKK